MRMDMVADFLNVGLGQCLVVRPADVVTGADAPIIVVDGGDDQPEFYAHPKRYALEEYLARECIRDIDLLILTHPHRDHIGGLKRIFSRYTVRSLITPFGPAPKSLLAAAPINGNAAEGLRLHQSILEQATAKGCRIETRTCGAQMRLGPVDLELYPLPCDAVDALASGINYCHARPDAPDIHERLSALDARLNEGSLCMRIRVYGGSVLVTTDQPLSYWDAHTDIRADVISGLHHGDTTRVSQEFLQKTGAGIAIISADTRGLYGLPHENIGAILREGGVERVLFTSGDRSKDTARGVRLAFSAQAPLYVRELE